MMINKKEDVFWDIKRNRLDALRIEPSLYKDVDVARAVIDYCINKKKIIYSLAYKEFDKSLYSDKEMVLKILRFFLSRDVAPLIDKELYKDEEIVLGVIKNINMRDDIDFVNIIPSKYITEKEYVIKAVKTNPYWISYTDFANNKEVALCALNIEGWVYECLSDELKNDKELAMLYIDDRDWDVCYEELGDVLKDDKDILYEILIRDESKLSDMPEFYKSDRELLIRVAEVNGNILYYADYSLADDEEFVKVAIRNYPLTLEDVSERLRDDKGFISDVIDILDEHCKKEKVPAYIYHYMVLAEAGPSVVRDEEIVIKAIRQNKENANLISEELLNNININMALIEIFGANAYYDFNISVQPLTYNEEFALKAVKYINFIDFCHPDFKDDEFWDGVEINNLLYYWKKNESILLEQVRRWPDTFSDIIKELEEVISRDLYEKLLLTACENE